MTLTNWQSISSNNMGTGEDDYNELEEHFINKQGLTDYCENGFKKVINKP